MTDGRVMALSMLRRTIKKKVDCGRGNLGLLDLVYPPTQDSDGWLLHLRSGTNTIDFPHLLIL
jgi:hypothetical protein